MKTTSVCVTVLQTGNTLITSSINAFLKVFTVWKAAHRDPPPSSCAHRGFSVKRAPPPLTGHLARLVRQGNNWVRQVGRPVRDVKKDGSVLQASLNTPDTRALKKARLEYKDRLKRSSLDSVHCSGLLINHAALAGSAGPGLPCARGRYCPAGAEQEVLCPPGTFTPHQGAISKVIFFTTTALQ